MTYLGTSPPVDGCTARRTCRQRYGERKAMTGSFRTIYLLPRPGPIAAPPPRFREGPSRDIAARCRLHGAKNVQTTLRGTQGYGWKFPNHIPSVAPQPHTQLCQLRFCDGPSRGAAIHCRLRVQERMGSATGNAEPWLEVSQPYTFSRAPAPYPTPPASLSRWPLQDITARRRLRAQKRAGSATGNAGLWLEISNHIPSAAPRPHTQLCQLRFCDGPRRTLPPVTGCVSRRTRNQRYGNAGPWLEVSEPYTFCRSQPHTKPRRLCLRGARKFETPRKGCRPLPVLQRGTPGRAQTQKATALSEVWPAPRANICAVCRGIQNTCIFILSMRVAGILFANAAKAWQNLKHNRLP